MAAKLRAKTPWGLWFINVLETSYESARLDRGWSYARFGNVKKLEIENSRVSALVIGTHRYEVIIEFPELRDKNKVFELIDGNPMFLSQVQGGKLPDELVASLQKAEIDLIPKSWSRIRTTCTCPDWGDPCKHRAAVYYILAEYIDNDPTILFTLRGINLRARYLQSEASETAKDDLIAALSYSSKAAAQPEGKPRVFPSVNYTGIVQALLPPSPAWAEPTFVSDLMSVYHTATGKEHQALDSPEEVFDKFIKIYLVYVTGLPSLPLLKDHMAKEAIRERFFARTGIQIVLTTGSNVVLCYATVTDNAGHSFCCTILELVHHFLGFSSDEGSSEYRFLFYFARLVRSLWKAGAFVPLVHVRKEQLSVYWQPFLIMPDVREALKDLSLYEPGFFVHGKKKLAQADALRIMTIEALTELVFTRTASRQFKPEFKNHIEQLFFGAKTLDVSSPKLSHLPESVKKWLSPMNIDFCRYQYRFVIDAVKGQGQMERGQTSRATSRAANGESSMNSELRDVFDAESEFRLSLEVLTEQTYLPIRKAVAISKNYELLKVPQALSNYIPEIQALGDKDSINVDKTRLVVFFDEAYNMLLELGVDVRLPKALHRAIKPKLVIEAKPKKTTQNLVSYLNLETVTAFNWRVALGDECLSLKEFKQLVQEQGRVVRFRDKWLVLDPEEVSSILKTASNKTAPTTLDFIKSYFTEALFAPDALMDKFKELFKQKEPAVPRGLSATLRHYQENGFRWIYSLLRSGFGCVLADDMGLGKTVQAIAVLQKLKEDKLLGEKGVLILAPAALLSNWEAELARFSPGFKVMRYHGAARDISKKSDIYITTYQTAARDMETFMERGFSAIIADEAHIMKNPDTAIARTVKAIPADYRIALSGTPVENKLEDLRSLFDFVLPGYLGSPAEFKRQYRVPIEVERNREAAEYLKTITAPFLLRRLKTDKSIIRDLPEKVEIDEYAVLTKKQAALYEAVTKRALKAAEREDDPFARNAVILKLLLELKQICDHPRVYDKTSAAVSQLSGKAQLLLELLTVILAGSEQVLVFSQYVEALEVLAAIVERELSEPVLIYHGGLRQKERDDCVREFQEGQKRIMLISLKAGSLGLNLTAASRVIHYDLWFNPAVEAQASDRAYRIGQSKNVFVHRLITKNTFEERINEILMSKKELAEMTVATGESWITRMKPEELEALFSLHG